MLAQKKFKTPRGAEILVLNTGAVIDAEAEAMLQALHSRSLGGIDHHLKVLEEKGAGNFMASFYVGYGHKSIGDCGTTTIFIENVSMLAAKAIQDWPLYSGQEASTRYIDFKHQPFLNSSGTKAGETILEKWRSFYVQNTPLVIEKLKRDHPIEEGQSAKVYEKAIKARAFDIMRSFLPAGATTKLAWHTNLRQAADKLMYLRHHPLQEVREIAETIEEALRDAHPHSFGHKRYEHTEAYNRSFMQHDYYYHNPQSPQFTVEGIEHVAIDTVPPEIFLQRPEKTELPKFLDSLGNITFRFLLDFGSFRDIQRHRAVTQRMPLLTDEIGFEEWYLEQLPETVREEALQLIQAQKDALHAMQLSKEEKQYYLPMGYKISNKLTGGLSSLVYLVELRSTRFVHPTLVKVALQMAETLKEHFPQLTLHIDETPHQFDIKRGKQDIELKK